MPTLKEIKGRIGSVKSTLKITSAMKLVSSAKLRKAQNAIEAMRPYERQLQDMLAMVQGASAGLDTKMGVSVSEWPENGGADTQVGVSVSGKTVIIAIASNSSLCGGFNANVIAKVRSVRNPGDIVYSVGRKMADAMRKDGFASPQDFTAWAEHPSYAPAAALVEQLAQDFAAGRISGVKMVYTHFVSTAKQVPVVEELMSPVNPSLAGSDAFSVASAPYLATGNASFPFGDANPDVIVEPSAKELVEVLLPKTVKLRLYAALLDSAAAEHAARTVAMQTATDNANNLLDELTLQYNKGRQQKITSEILDLAGGAIEG